MGEAREERKFDHPALVWRQVKQGLPEASRCLDAFEVSGQVMDHRTLLRGVWGPSYGDERNYLRTFIQRLRAKLEADPRNPRIIVTAGSRGYRFGEPAIVADDV